MECQRCHQHNPPGREHCWNCGAPLEPADDSARLDGEASGAGAQEVSPQDDVSQLGTLGPLRAGMPKEKKAYPVVSGVPPQQGPAARAARRFLARGIIAGALTGGVALAALFGLLASAAGGFIEASRTAPGTTLFVPIAQGFMMGAVNGAIIGALATYYGGGIWTGAIAGAALSAGLWLAQMLFTGSVLAMPAQGLAATLMVLGLAGAAIGALVGAVVESVSLQRD
jgi:hypothetical protein